MLDAYLARMGFASAEPTPDAAAVVIAWFVQHFSECGTITVDERLGMSDFTLACVKQAALFVAGNSTAAEPPEPGSYEWLESFGRNN